MRRYTQLAALATSLILVTAATSAQTPSTEPRQSPPTSRLPGADGSSSNDTVLRIADGQVEWIEISNVSALTDGVIERIELEPGMPAAKGQSIGNLYSKRAELLTEKSKIAANNRSGYDSAVAKKELALAVLARLRNGRAQIKDLYSVEDVQKAEAEVKVAHEAVNESLEQMKLYAAEHEIAKQQVKEHTIVAPFDGIVIERMKNPGENVSADIPVVRLGNLDRLRVFAYVPLRDSFKVHEGDVVEVEPNMPDGVDSPVKEKKFRGKVTFVDPEIQPVGEKARRIFVEVTNPTHELNPGMNVSLTVYLGTGAKAGGSVKAAGLPTLPPASSEVAETKRQ